MRDDREQTELRRTSADSDKLIAESHKFAAEQQKLFAEEHKRDHSSLRGWLAPALAIAGVIIGALLFGAPSFIARLIGHG